MFVATKTPQVMGFAKICGFWGAINYFLILFIQLIWPKPRWSCFWLQSFPIFATYLFHFRGFYIFVFVFFFKFCVLAAQVLVVVQILIWTKINNPFTFSNRKLFECLSFAEKPVDEPEKPFLIIRQRKLKVDNRLNREIWQQFINYNKL